MHTNMVLHTKSKKKITRKKKFTLEKLLCVLYMWSSELGHIYLLI